ncbi:MAG: trypsin-like peptidase domain-containing protein, partial [Bradymonadaceae bacterium]
MADFRNIDDIPGWMLCLGASLALTLAAPAGAQESDESTGDDKIWTTADESASPQTDRPMTTKSISGLVEEVSPAVVNIIVAYKGSAFGQLFGEKGKPPMPGPQGGIGQGSGFIIHPDGYVLTNYHVVESAKTIRVRRKDNTEYEATVVGVDPKTDIALLKLDADQPLPVLPLGDSDQWQVGDYVVAIGNPLGLN